MDRIRELERKLVRVEGTLCVVLVLLILVMAGYNVLYRNVLVPLQSHWAHSGPPVTATSPAAEGAETKSAEPGEAKSAANEPKKKGGAGGFGGAFGGGDDSGGEDEGGDELDEPSQADEPDEEADGFGGAFGEGADEDEEDEGDDSGFGGAFGKPSKDDEKADEGDEFFVEDEFTNLPDITAEGEEDVNEGPVGGPPPPGSFAAWGVDFVDSIKLDWIDVFGRHLVIIVSFLGAAIATHRQKHINIDALSKILKANGRRITGILTNMLAVAVCLVLANSGSKLVAIGREYPREIVPFADQWMFQLMFPIGFGLLALHFGVRLLEAATGIDPVDPAEIAAEKPADEEDEEAEKSSKPRPASEEAEDEAEDEDVDEPEAEAEGGSDPEPEGDSADEQTDVGLDSEETSPGDAPEPPDDSASSVDESLDEHDEEDEEEDEEEGRR